MRSALLLLVHLFIFYKAQTELFCYSVYNKSNLIQFSFPLLFFPKSLRQFQTTDNLQLMSQYIEDSRQYHLEAPSLIYGIFSKIISSSNQSKKSLISKLQKSSNAFYQSKTSDRFVQQLKLAEDLQHVIINQNYQKMKNKLKKYGRSQSSSLNKMFNQQNQQKKKQCLHYANSHNRIVYIDRKYNNQFAIKYSTVFQAEQINKLKRNLKNSLDKKHTQPLVQNFRQTINVKKQRFDKICKSLSVKKRSKSLINVNKQTQFSNVQLINKFICTTEKQNKNANNPVLLQIQNSLKSKGKKLFKKRQKVKTSWEKQTNNYKYCL